MSGIELTEAALAELAEVYKEYDQECKDARKEAYKKAADIAARSGVEAIGINPSIDGYDGYVHLSSGLIGSGIITNREPREGWFPYEHSAVVSGVKFIQLETKEEAGNE
jgi:hypothetical protein